MRLVTYEPLGEGDRRVGLLVGERVLDLRRAIARLDEAWAHLPGPLEEAVLSLTGLLEAGEPARALLGRVAERSGELVEVGGLGLLLDAAHVLPPVPRPPTIRDFYAFEEHVRRARARRGLKVPPEWYEAPAFYFSNPLALYGPGAEIPYPVRSDALDFELEVAAVIGRLGRDLASGAAEAVIAGYTILNDWSARDLQREEMKVGLGPAKGKDFATSLGPALVTPDELSDRRLEAGRYDLTMVARINGEEVARGNWKEIHWSFAELVSRASERVTLHPGEVIASGSMAGGCLLEGLYEERGWLRPGDVVELEVERLGTLRNTIVDVG